MSSSTSSSTLGEISEGWRCNGTTHNLRCQHTVTLNTWDCSADCLYPQFGTKATFPRQCPTCLTIADEHHVLQEIGNLRELRLTAEAMQADHDHPVQSEAIESIEEYIFQREMKLEQEVSEDVWALYVSEGEDGIKRRQEERRIEEEQRRVVAEIPQWQSSRAAEREKAREDLENALEADEPYPVQELNDITERLLRDYYEEDPTKNLWEQEYRRVSREHHRQMLELFRSYLPAFQAAKNRRNERRRAATQLQNQIEGTE